MEVYIPQVRRTAIADEAATSSGNVTSVSEQDTTPSGDVPRPGLRGKDWIDTTKPPGQGIV